MTTPAAPRWPHRPTSGQLRLTGRPALLVLALGIVVLTLFLPLRQWLAQRSQIAALAAQATALQTQVSQLQQAQQRWSDPAYVAAQARARLHYVRPGEVGYVVLGLAPAGSRADVVAAPSTPAPAGPWYERLWSSVQAADATAGEPAAGK